MVQPKIVVVVGESVARRESNPSVLDVVYPENGMHPAKQIEYIESICSQASKNKVSYKLWTVSPYVLNAIEVYSCIFGFADKVEYYDDFEEDMRNCTNKIENIYSKLAKPLQTLENRMFAE